MPAPAVFPALAVMAGIALGVCAPVLTRVASVLLFAAGGTAAAAWWSGRGRTFIISAILGFTSAGVLLGSADLAAATRAPLREFFDHARKTSTAGVPPITVDGVVRQDATPAEYGASMTIDVTRVHTACGWLPAAGGLRVAVTGSVARERVAAWRAGRRVEMPVVLRVPTTFRDPGVPDEAFGLMRRGIVLAGAVKSGALVDVVRRGHAAAEGAAALRAYTRRAMAASIPTRPGAAVVTAILIGDRAGLDTELERRLQEAGTYHVIAISGGNIAILAGLGFLMLRATRVPPRAASLALACLICAYGYVAGGGASVARATLAATIYLLATAADLRSPALNVLATVALVAVVYDPLAVFDPGLLLSYGATLALVMAADKVLKRISGPSASRRLASGAMAILAGTLAAELALFPVVATIFHRVTLAGLALNFIAIPLMTVAQLGGMVTLLLYPFSTAAATASGLIAGLAAEGLIRSTALLDVMPGVTWRVPSPPVFLTGIYYGAWVVLLLVGHAKVRATAAIAGIGSAMLIALPALADGVLVHRSPSPGELRVTFLDVGQGDAIVAQFPNGHALLVDAAGLAGSAFDMGERVITPALLALGLRRLEYLAITHGDPDHVEGAPSVARDFAPRELWEGVPVPPHETLRALRQVVARERGATRLVRPDDRVEMGGVELRILHPSEPGWERQRVRNDDSIVMELRYGDVSIVLPGDIGAEIETSIAPKLSDAPLRILKAAHHGSATSTADAWLAATRPTAVIFSCGRDNRFGHPAPSVVDRVNSHKAEIFRTDLDGAVTITTDGKAAIVSTFRDRRRLTLQSNGRRTVDGGDHPANPSASR